MQQNHICVSYGKYQEMSANGVSNVREDWEPSVVCWNESPIVRRDLYVYDIPISSRAMVMFSTPPLVERTSN